MTATPKPAGTWDWDGNCFGAPHGNYTPGTLSVGVFRWEAKKSGEGTKRGPVYIRLKGGQVDREAVRSLAVHICWLLNTYANRHASAEEQMAEMSLKPGTRTVRR